MIVLTALAVVFLGAVLWLRRLWFSSLPLHLSRFWSPGPGGLSQCCKWLLLRLPVSLCRRKGRFDFYTFGVKYDPRGCGLLSPEQEASLDDICTPPSSDKFPDGDGLEDELLVWASTERGECVLARVRRHPSARTAEAWLYLRTADGHSYVLPAGHGVTDCSRSGLYAAAGLRLEQLVPMRRWRVAFNGLLRCTTRGDAVAHVQLGLVCKSSSNVLEHRAHFPANFVARQLARTSWTKHGVPNVNRLLDEVDSYAQLVFCTGSVGVDGEAPQELFLWGFRIRSIENGRYPLRDFGHIMGRTNSGITFCLREVGIHGLIDRYQTGIVALPSTEVGPVTDCSQRILTDGSSFKKQFMLEFGPGFHRFQFDVRSDYQALDEHTLKTHCLGQNAEVVLSWFPCTVNEYPGCLLHLSGPRETSNHFSMERKKPETPQLPRLGDVDLASSESADTLSLDEAACRSSCWSGGKGASLAALRMLAKQGLQMNVPEGFVITTTAYEKFSRHPDFQAAVRSLSSITSFTESQSIEACNKAVRLLESLPLPEDVQAAIGSTYRMVFGEASRDIRVAVRSSAVGEDSEDMSSAGQMDTFLAVTGVETVMKMVAKCWSSQFTHIACGYKRHYGQPLDSPMAVVVQAMAPADAAGVLFTCDSRTGDARRVLITANDGLGDSVVSGKTDPDTVVLERCAKTGDVRVAEICIGAKQHKTVVLEGGGTELQPASSTNGTKCCLSEEQIMRLGRLAGELENAFGGPRDVEWAFKGDTLYILQARPVTSLYLPTDVELMHELDEGFRTMDECLTKANIGEVVNCSQSPLGSAIFTNGLMLFNKEDTNERAKRFHIPYHDRFFVTALGNVFFPASNDMFNMRGEGSFRKGLAYAMRGGCMEDEDVNRLMRERAKLRFAGSKFYSIGKMVSDLWNCEKLVTEGYRKYYDMKLPVGRGDDSRKIFEEICRSLMIMSRSVQVHGATNLYSILANSLAFTMLAKLRGEWTDAVLSDFGSLMTSAGDVWSAEVPCALQKMAAEISRHPEAGDFKRMDAESALRWLQEKDAGKTLREFLSRHGHRCINEFDVYSKTWAMDPKPLVKNLQVMTGTVDAYTKEPLPIEEAVDRLDIKLTSFKRKLLIWLMRKCRRAVSLRELSKNLLVKTVDALRSACWLLGEQMHREGRLPEPSVLFFLDILEIDLLLRTRSPKLVAKALRRQRLHPFMKKRMFPELVKGIPTMVSDTNENGSVGARTLVKGTPVSGGIAEGPARVVHTIDEATQIERGDVLVAYCTDIAWSPFFPLLSGVVTELGGLISHGAVVAREYGIPCIVGATGATSAIRPGSMVQLDGSKGTLRQIDTN
ncbi:rifampicin phosphotransferase-like isoform X1 [Dermacentor albipictus]|uniref:rifampicin phosphotransferase-like isoform X1 n=1 Tax=Dermacentor albipictus TaxID=60249 RepID=UPI0038FC819E